MRAAKVLDVISRLPGSSGHSSFGRRLFKDSDQITESKKTTKLGLNWLSSGAAGAQSLRSSIGWTLMRKKFQKFQLGGGRDKVPGWKCLYLHRKLQLFISVYVDDIRMAGRTKTCPRCWQHCKNIVNLEDQTSLLDQLSDQHKSITEL